MFVHYLELLEHNKCAVRIACLKPIYHVLATCGGLSCYKVLV